LSSLAIGLSSWILEDGNYDAVVFAVGKSVKFALEFSFEKYSICNEPTRLTAKDIGCEYDAVGECVFSDAEAEVQVMSFGEISAYCHSSVSNLKAGDRVTGNMYLGVDHFAYYEWLHDVPGIPPLMYEWQIERILFDVTPLIMGTDERGHDAWVVDETRVKYREVLYTDPRLRHPKDTLGDYILICSRFEKPPHKDVSGLIN
jgi:hypothetical protein